MKLGIFGLIGSGKTTVMNYLQEKYNFKTLNLDDVSKVVLSQEQIINLIKNSFPESYDFKNKIINRSKLREVLFLNKKKNKLFAKIVWPEISKLTNDILKKVPNNKNIIIEGALLPVLNLDLDKIVLIETKKNKTIINRVAKRDNRQVLETKSIIKIQKFWIKNSNFDVLIKNDSTLEELYLKIDKIMEKYKIK